MEQNKLPKNIRQIGEKEDWIRVYMEDYVHTYIQKLRDLQENGVSGGILLGKKQRMNGVMHLFIRGAAVVEDPFWKMPGQTPEQIFAQSSVYFPGLEICGFFVSSRLNRSSEVELVRIFEMYFSSEYQVLFDVRDREEEVFCYSGHGMLKLAGYYIYYEKNEEMQSYIVRQESLRALGKEKKGEETPENCRERERAGQSGGKTNRQGRGNKAKINIPYGIGTGNSAPGDKEGQKTDTGPGKWIKKRENPSGKKTVGKKKIRKGDMVVRIVSIAGIFILAFLLFSDQIKFSKLNNDSEINGSLLSGIVGETQAVPAGADSSYILGGTEESTDTFQSGQAAETLETEESTDQPDTSESSGQQVDAVPGNDVQTTKESGEGTTGVKKETDSTQAQENRTGTGREADSYVFPLKYLVKKGDSLYAISEKYYGSTDMVDAICLENNIADPSALQYGTVLTLPAR